MTQQGLLGPDYTREWENARNVAMAVKEYDLPLSMLATKPIGHGGVERLMDIDLAKVRMTATLDYFQEFLSAFAPERVGLLSADALAEAMSTQVSNGFRRLVDSKPCPISPELKLYLARNRPPVGTTFTSKEEEENAADKLQSPDLLAAFTFVGQFIDHDLTMNMLDLVVNQPGTISNFATARIDLDSVYGPREILSSSPGSVFDKDMRFVFVESAPGTLDLPRAPMVVDAETQNVAAIFDARNDENKMILQVHMLVQKLHNSFIDKGLSYDEARRRTILNWQSVVLHDYLPKIIDEQTFSQLSEWIDAEKFDKIKVLERTPHGSWMFRLPHEFSIGFRMGHSQLRPAYKVNGGAPVPLFDNTLMAKPGETPPFYNDLRGGQKLTADQEIDWKFFLGSAGPKANAIDSKVTQAVFDLPPRAIPDTIKFVSNLPMRNLVRSEKLEICSGEDLAAFYGIDALTREMIEPDEQMQAYFITDQDFHTPLWYYLLKEAETARSNVGSGPQNPLGRLGSRLVGEVIFCSIRFNDINLWDEKPGSDWSITGKDEVTLLDIVEHLKL